jgi:hypothetical protein
MGLLVAGDTGILVGSYEILCNEDGTTMIDFRLLGVEAVPSNPAAKVHYQTGTT